MCRHMIVGLFTLAALAVSQVAADVVITLEPKDADMNPIAGPVDLGAQVIVDILVSVTADDSPLADLRLLQFDFAATSAAIEVNEFTWALDPGIGDDFYMQLDLLPVPSAAYIGMSGLEGMILNLDETPIRVASVTITVNGDGTLDAGASDPGSETAFRADFASPVDYSPALGNIGGGAFEFALPDPGGGGDGDSDGDGVSDVDDQFPDDPEESVDTDGDGLGDNADEDDDDDGVADEEDKFPLDPTETQDTDRDGIGDNTDIDDDGDGVFDVDDDLPVDPDEQTDTDSDGIGDNADPDDDGDGLVDADDPDPLTPQDTGDGDSGDGTTPDSGDGTTPDSDDGNTNVGSRATSGICGLGMVGASMFILMGLSVTCLHQRSQRRRAGKR